MTNCSTKAAEDEVYSAAVHVFELSKPGADGVTVEAKALHILETTGKRPAILDGPDMPPEAGRAWCWFKDLHGARQTGMGFNPIGWADIHGYMALHRIQPTPWELRLLTSIDRAFCTVNATQPPPEE